MIQFTTRLRTSVELGGVESIHKAIAHALTDALYGHDELNPVEWSETGRHYTCGVSANNFWLRLEGDVFTLAERYYMPEWVALWLVDRFDAVIL